MDVPAPAVADSRRGRVPCASPRASGMAAWTVQSCYGGELYFRDAYDGWRRVQGGRSMIAAMARGSRPRLTSSRAMRSSFATSSPRRTGNPTRRRSKGHQLRYLWRDKLSVTGTSQALGYARLLENASVSSKPGFDRGVMQNAQLSRNATNYIIPTTLDMPPMRSSHHRGEAVFQRSVRRERRRGAPYGCPRSGGHVQRSVRARERRRGASPMDVPAPSCSRL